MENKIYQDLLFARNLIRSITDDNLGDEQWIKYLRMSLGYLKDSISELEKCQK